MQVILLQTVQNLGELGEIVNVKPGFARNFLIPQAKASMATEANIKRFEERKSELVAKEKDSLAAANARAESIEGLEITITSNASPEGKLYGSIGPREIAEKLTQNGFPVDKSEVIMSDGPIREAGDIEIGLSFHADVNATFKLSVEGEET
ncbi:LSU ribosomal protein L9p [hydrothermal vent metagenome]|uniref:LSU ribosomal protein L9p n=1 Tax=hydrothermal vent metagenome TaxID=652676 RepID=A0A3B0VP06_9ZZZZ